MTNLEYALIHRLLEAEGKEDARALLAEMRKTAPTLQDEHVKQLKAENAKLAADLDAQRGVAEKYYAACMARNGECNTLTERCKKLEVVAEQARGAYEQFYGLPSRTLGMTMHDHFQNMKGTLGDVGYPPRETP
jgi:hypothetical protein